MTTSTPGSLYSIETEQSLLGALLINNEAFGAVCDVLTADNFAEPIHRTIYEVAARHIRDGKRVTPVTLKTSLPNSDIGGLGIHAYLSRLCAEATTVLNARDYARVIRDLHIARQLAAIGDDIRNASDATHSPSEALSSAWKRVEALRLVAEEATDDTLSIGEAARRMADIVTDIRQGKQEPAISTGLIEYDRALGGGYRRGRLYVEAGRPGAGKTVKALVSARRIAKAGHGVRFQSLEIDNSEVAARILASELSRSHTPVPYRDIVTGQIDDERHERIAEASLRMQDWPLQIDCTGGLTMAQIESRSRLQKERALKSGKNLDVVVIDYLGLVKATDRYKGNQTAELGDITLAAKTMSKKLDVAVVLLSQLSRGVEAREDKRPNMADLRQSGNIEEHADAVTFCYRPAYYLEKSPKYRASDPEAMAEMDAVKNSLELIIDKNRLGPTGARQFWCDVSLNSIEDLARQ